MITILNRLELHNIKEQMDEGRPTLPTFTNFFNSEEVPPTSLLPTLGFITMVERVVVPSVWTGTPGAAAMQRTLDVESRGRTWS